MSPIAIHWLEQREANLPGGNDWLSESELTRLATLRFPKRRADWLLGRWTAKLAVSAYLGRSTSHEALCVVEIHPAESGAPLALVAGEPASVSISISHRDGVAMCAVGPPDTKLGCDLELIGAHSEAFIRDYFTQEEQLAIAGVLDEERQRLITLMWSAKESALKALGVGLRADTRSVGVRLAEQLAAGIGWNPLRVQMNNELGFEGWWNQSGLLIRTVVVLLGTKIADSRNAAFCEEKFSKQRCGQHLSGNQLEVHNSGFLRSVKFLDCPNRFGEGEKCLGFPK
jgi:4'-phosphopantetheinyl transferase